MACCVDQSVLRFHWVLVPVIGNTFLITHDGYPLESKLSRLLPLPNPHKSCETAQDRSAAQMIAQLVNFTDLRTPFPFIDGYYAASENESLLLLHCDVSFLASMPDMMGDRL